MRAIMLEVGDMIVDHFVHLKDKAVTKPSTLANLRGGLSGHMVLQIAVNFAD